MWSCQRDLGWATYTLICGCHRESVSQASHLQIGGQRLPLCIAGHCLEEGLELLHCQPRVIQLQEAVTNLGEGQVGACGKQKRKVGRGRGRETI